VTRNEWGILAREALEAQEWGIARKAFSELKSLRELEFLHSLEERRRRGGPEASPEAIRADLVAYFSTSETRFQEAAELYKKAGLDAKALQMFTDLRHFQQAKVRI
jgi:intraflagellar transport protein 122